MNNTPLVSILVPIYNVEKYLGKCLDSIFSQTYKNIEYVFVDDCSTDRSLDVLALSLAKYNIPSEKTTIIKHQVNEGIAVSRNDCIKSAHGEYVQFIDSDDWVEPNMTEELVNASKKTTIDIVSCCYLRDYLTNSTTYHKDKFSDSCLDNMKLTINYEISPVLWKLLIRRKLFDNFDITPHIDIVEDYIISIKLFYYANSFNFVDKYLYHYIQYNQERVSFQKLRSITNHIKGVGEIETFLKEKKIHTDEIRHLLNLRKFNIKSNFLTKELLDYKAFKTTFPESNKAWRFIDYSPKEKIKFWLAEHNMFFILKIFQ